MTGSIDFSMLNETTEVRKCLITYNKTYICSVISRFDHIQFTQENGQAPTTQDSHKIQVVYSGLTPLLP